MRATPRTRSRPACRCPVHLPLGREWRSLIAFSERVPDSGVYSIETSGKVCLSLAAGSQPAPQDNGMERDRAGGCRSGRFPIIVTPGGPVHVCHARRVKAERLVHGRGVLDLAEVVQGQFQRRPHRVPQRAHVPEAAHGELGSPSAYYSFSASRIPRIRNMRATSTRSGQQCRS
jgi:hypothetical protein